MAASAMQWWALWFRSVFHKFMEKFGVFLVSALVKISKFAFSWVSLVIFSCCFCYTFQLLKREEKDGSAMQVFWEKKMKVRVQLVLFPRHFQHYPSSKLVSISCRIFSLALLFLITCLQRLSFFEEK